MERHRLAAGIDIGGTKIAIGLVDRQGTIQDQVTFSTESRNGIPDACQRISKALTILIKNAGLQQSDLLGIGIGCPGPMNRETGEILNPHTLPGWETLSLTKGLCNATGLPIALENDADAALLGECFVGAGNGAAHVVMLTFGTGVGGAALSAGQILRGVNDEHPEIGLIPVLPSEATDYSGVPGSLESIASGSAIGNAGKKYGFKNSPAVFEAAAQGDAQAIAIIDRARTGITLACLSLAHTLCPERILLGGGLMDDHFDRFAPAIEMALSKATLLPPNKISVAKAMLGNLAGIVGAASLIFSHPAPLNSAR